MTASVTFTDLATVIHAAWLNAVNRSVLALKTKTASYVLTNDDGFLLVSTTAAPCTISLPANPEDGQSHWIKKVPGSLNALTVVGNGNPVEGSSNYSSASIGTIGTTWWFRYSADSNSLGWWEVI